MMKAATIRFYVTEVGLRNAVRVDGRKDDDEGSVPFAPLDLPLDGKVI